MGPESPKAKESPAAREARFRAWWAQLSPEQRRAEVRAGHVRVNNLPEPPAKPARKRKRTRAAQERTRQLDAIRDTHGDAYVHMTPLKKWGVDLHNSLAARDSAAAGL